MTKNQKICVYSCITGDYDDVRELPFLEEGIDYYLFTNNKKIKSKTWNVIYIEDNELDNIRLARKIKILGYPKVVDKYDISVWIDGNISIRKKVKDYLREQCNLEKYAMVGFKHSVRDCAYEEGITIVQFHKAKKDIIEKQLAFLEANNYPRHNGLIESGVLVRKIHDPKVKETMKIWFDCILNQSTRDQLSFNYSAYQAGLEVQYLNMNVFNNDYFYLDNPNSHKDKEKPTHYRIYFGDESKDYDFKYDVQDNYFPDAKGIYTIETKVIRDTGVIILEPDIFVSNLNYTKLTVEGAKLESVYLENGIEVGDTKIFLGSRPRIFLNGVFPKDKIIKIKADFKISKELEEEKIINKLYLELNHYKIENKELRELTTSMTEENKQLKADYKHKDEELKLQKAELNRILNSKGWALLEKMRKLKGGKHYEK